MKKLYLVLLACLFSANLISQSDELDSLILDNMETYHVPGVAAAIITPSGICWEGYYGMANIEEDRPVDDSTIFLLASVSKTITASAMLKLHQEGYFELDDDINSYLPFEIHIPDYPDDTITFRHLLTHTSSIDDHWMHMGEVWGEECEALSPFLYNYLDTAGEYYHANSHFLSDPPGSTYHYSNIGFALLGLLVEEISETPFNEYCNTFLFDEMEMNSSGWFLSEIDTNIMAMPYSYNTNTQEHDAYGYYCFPDYPDGLLKSSPHDLSNFLLTYIQGGMYNDVSSILEPETIQLLTPYDFSDGLTWGIRELDYDPNYTMWGHTGGMLGVSTIISFNPQDSIGVIVLTNGESGGGLFNVNELVWEYARENCIPSNPVSTSELVDLNRVDIFPNPNQGLVNINLGSLTNVSIKVLNLSGQLVYSKENINSTLYQFELSAVPGVYILEISAGGEKQSFKLLKQ